MNTHGALPRLEGEIPWAYSVICFGLEGEDRSEDQLLVRSHTEEGRESIEVCADPVPPELLFASFSDGEEEVLAWAYGRPRLWAHVGPEVVGFKCALACTASTVQCGDRGVVRFWLDAAEVAQRDEGFRRACLAATALAGNVYAEWREAHANMMVADVRVMGRRLPPISVEEA